MSQQLVSATINPHINRQNNRPYRIVMVHPSAGVNWSGGSETFVIELARRLSAEFEVELLSGAACGSFSTPISGIPRSYAYPILHQPLIAPLWRSFATHPEVLVEHLTSFFPCVIHLLRQPADLIFPNNDYGGLAMAAFVRALTGTPILFAEHCGLLQGGRLLKRNLRFRPERCVVFSEAMAAFVRTHQPQQATSIIPNGVDLQRFTPEGSSINFGLAKPVVLCVASLHNNSHKRVELAIQAVARLPQASLLLCGDGPDRAYFQALGERLLGSERFAIRSFAFEQMPQVYRSVDVFTLPSLNEPFGLAYIEAMASGLPVVAPDDEMRRYIIADAGLLCDVTDPDTYAEAIACTLSRAWGLKPRQNAMRFSWDTLALRYRDLILQTIIQSQKALTR
jgi:glycosyltransferase involved in cell wall biosynthesis